jgi:NitT/TauT family transport system substrate-binding protein
MMKSVAELLGTDKAKAGYLNEADYARTVDVLMSDKTDPVITKQPVGAYSHVVWDKAYGH